MRVSPKTVEKEPKPTVIVAGDQRAAKAEVKTKNDSCIANPDQSLARQCAILCGKTALPKIIPYEEPKTEERCCNPDIMMCEVKKIGNSEQLMCKPLPKAKPLELITELKSKRDPRVLRVLRCKFVQNGCAEFLICQEIKQNDDDMACNQLVEEVSERQISNKKHKKQMRHLAISKKLVCRQEVIDTTGTMELVCKVLEVREIKDEGARTEKLCTKRKGSPFTYKDLLKRSEEVRKAAEEELAKQTKKPGC